MSMKQFSCISGMIILILTLNSCEKIIDIELEDSKESIVIEATMTNTSNPFIVKVSKTTPYFGEQTNNPVSGAVVTVKSEKGVIKYFKEVSPGLYTYDRNIAFPGFLYIITVEYEGVKYTAKSFMNEPVSISDLGFSYFEGYGILKSGYKVNVFLSDPVEVENYYRIKYFINGKQSSAMGGESLYTDQLFNGQGVGLGQRWLVFKASDTLTVELQTIDKAAYDYFSTLESITGLDIMQTVAPANPISNFNNGALGYFSAYTLDRKTVVIKDYIDN